jgi:hypothetical protein
MPNTPAKPPDTSTRGPLTAPRPQEAFQHIATSSSGPADVIAWYHLTNTTATFWNYCILKESWSIIR